MDEPTDAACVAGGGMEARAMGSYEHGYPELQSLAHELSALTHRIDQGLVESGFLPLVGLKTGAQFLEWSKAMQMLLAGFSLPAQKVEDTQ